MPQVTKKAVNAVLARGAELVSKKTGWFQGEFSNNDSNIKKANCFCALGAVARASLDIATELGVEFKGAVEIDPLTEGTYVDDWDSAQEQAKAKAINFANELYEAANDRLEESLPEDTYTDSTGQTIELTSVPEWNDAPHRTQDEVVTLFLNALTAK